MIERAGEAAFRFADDVVLRVRGDRSVLRHFGAEYGPAYGNGKPAVEIEIASGRDRGAALRGGHKTVAWDVRPGDPEADPLGATIGLAGRPRSFGLSLVQGVVIEPLIALAAARRDVVLLPAAALATDAGAIVLVGRSRSGKSTLVARARARDAQVLGDDQILVGPGATCAAFPRRLRLYADLRTTAPAAWRKLPARHRAALAVRGVVRTASRGWVAPSLPVAPAEMHEGALPIARVALLDRTGDAAALRRTPLAIDELVSETSPVLDAQRERLRPAGGPWPDALDALLERERALLAAALRDVPAERIVIPASLDAPAALAAVEAELGIG